MITNTDRLVKLSLQGEIKHPVTANPYYISKEGMASTLPAMGGITYNVKVGDPLSAGLRIMWSRVLP